MSSLPRERIVIERIPPQNPELEQAVLGALMLEPDLIHLVQDYLSEDSFYLEAHAIVFRVMRELNRRGIPSDLVSVLAELKTRGELDQVGGAGYVTALVNTVPTAANIEYHAQQVAGKHLLRQLIRRSTEIIDSSYRQEFDTDEILNQAQKTINELVLGHTGKEFQHIGTPTRQIYETLSENYVKKHELHEEIIAEGLKTHYGQLDGMIGGLKSGEFIILAARPSMGKTSLALNIALNVAQEEERLPVAVFSLEMSVERLAMRMLSTISRVDQTKIELCDMDNDEWQEVAAKVGKLVALPVFVDDSSFLSIQQLRAKARRIAMLEGVRLIVVDYLQLLTGEARENRVQEVSEISRSLKAIAGELNIPVLAVSQLSRKVEERSDRRPILSDLRESGSIEQDADVVMFLYDDSYYAAQREAEDAEIARKREAEEAEIARKGKTPYGDEPRSRRRKGTLPYTELRVAKNRNGPTGMVKLTFIKRQTRFEEYTERYT